MDGGMMLSSLMVDPLSDCSPLISAAVAGKLRLVRLLVEGGAQVDGRNPKGETALLAACKALRGEPTGPETMKILTFLLQNKADPNAQDRDGRTPLMYACMARAGSQVAAALLSAGADPVMEDYSGASALVYAINTQHQSTLKVLTEACRSLGRDIIIFATETDVSGGPVTRGYLNVLSSPDTSPGSCMSPSDIILKTGSASSTEGENIFNFRGTSKKGSRSSSNRLSSCELSPGSHSESPRHRLSEPWLAIHNLTRLKQAYDAGRSIKPEEAPGAVEVAENRPEDAELSVSVSAPSPPEVFSSDTCGLYCKSTSMMELPHPTTPVRAGFLPALAPSCSVTSLVSTSCSEGKTRKSPRRHSVQLELARHSDQ